MYTDTSGTDHEVTIATSFHDYWTGAGERLARCLCGWWDHYPYVPGGQAHADMRLHFRAADAHAGKPAS